VHAAGVIMSSEPLADLIPIMRREQDGQIITQFDYPSCEKLGLVKMDFLGLRNLTILDDAIANIEANRGETIDLDELSRTLDDKATYELLARADTLGVFQLDGGGMRTLLRLMQPDNFEDISAALALYRPGPMGANSHTNYALRKTGKQPITPIHPELEEALADILGPTYGLIVYQEQVQHIAQRVAGYTLGKADMLRRAMGKKKKEILDAEFVPFEAGMQANGYSAAAIKALWDVLVPFSDYAFNKSHTAAYGLVSYWTGYLKANYPAEYMAALLTSVRDDKDKSALYLNECRHMGIKVLPPDVNDLGRQLRGGRGRHPLRARGDPQRRAGTSSSRSSPRGGEGRLHLVRGLPAQVPRHRPQQAHHRVARQGGGLRLPRPPPRRAHAHPRGLRRRARRREAPGGDRSGLPLRRLRVRTMARVARRSSSLSCRPCPRSSGTSRPC
jgi:DNA-directed DNA polymerase III PolC